MCRIGSFALCLTALGCRSELDESSFSAAALAGPGGAATGPSVEADAFARRAPNSTRENQLFFNSGQGFYYQAWLPAPSSIDTREGLGPLYNAAACADCHLGGGRGRPPLQPGEPFVGLVLRLGTGERGAAGEPVSDPVYGEQLQTLAIGELVAEGTPQVQYAQLPGGYPDGELYQLRQPTYQIDDLQYGAAGTPLRLSPRVAPATIGLGLLEAIPEARLHELEDPDDRDGDGVSGRINRVWDRQRGEVAVGRFGWKSEQPNLRQQIAAALAADVGVTSLLYPESDCARAEIECSSAAAASEPELAERVLDRMESHLRLLAVPERRRADDPAVQRGEQVFQQLGCAACHVPRHVTSATAALAELRSQPIWPYTDLLLHDLGAELADDRPSFAAVGAEWRTPPLWGLGLYRVVSGHERLLHDGRADGVAEAILWHGGEGAAARAAFQALPIDARRQLIDFVESL